MEKKGKRKYRKERDKKDERKHKIHKKFWEELIAYLPFIRHEPHGNKLIVVAERYQTDSKVIS
jgi:hypothetical protein